MSDEFDDFEDFEGRSRSLSEWSDIMTPRSEMALKPIQEYISYYGGEHSEQPMKKLSAEQQSIIDDVTMILNVYNQTFDDRVTLLQFDADNEAIVIYVSKQPIDIDAFFELLIQHFGEDLDLDEVGFNLLELYDIWDEPNARVRSVEHQYLNKGFEFWKQFWKEHSDVVPSITIFYA